MILFYGVKYTFLLPLSCTTPGVHKCRKVAQKCAALRHLCAPDNTLRDFNISCTYEISFNVARELEKVQEEPRVRVV